MARDALEQSWPAKAGSPRRHGSGGPTASVRTLTRLCGSKPSGASTSCVKAADEQAGPRDEEHQRQRQLRHEQRIAQRAPASVTGPVRAPWPSMRLRSIRRAKNIGASDEQDRGDGRNADDEQRMRASSTSGPPRQKYSSGAAWQMIRIAHEASKRRDRSARHREERAFDDSCRAKGPRPPPRAPRIANSRWRRSARASSRFAPRSDS